MERQLRRSKTLVVADRNLSGIDLSGRALLGIEFRRCELANAKFARSDLSLARFIDCSLYMADFTEAVLYTTWFYECNMTKAVFRDTYLLGFRLRNVDITKAEFDDIPAIGLERKSRVKRVPEDLVLPLMGVLPIGAQGLEKDYPGIGMKKFDRIIYFIQEGADHESRTKIRAAETAKYLRRVHAENDYQRKAAHYYVIERRLRRKAMAGSPLARLRRIQDFVFGELLLKYGSSLMRPIIALVILAVIGIAVTYTAPLISATTGLHPAEGVLPYGFCGWNARSVLSLLNVTFFYLTAPAGGSGATLTGWVKSVFVVYILLALWLLALIFDAFVRRIDTSK